MTRKDSPSMVAEVGSLSEFQKLLFSVRLALMNRKERLDYIREQRAQPLTNEDGSLNEFKKSKAQIFEFLKSQGSSDSRIYADWKELDDEFFDEPQNTLPTVGADNELIFSSFRWAIMKAKEEGDTERTVNHCSSFASAKKALRSI
tara:strand:- start:37 stop:474 length:438 start_codon:yes stop_codon:yes gene_type:complete